ncbi:hypothetical protein ACROYT_G001319 [Oculina patagonica]
MDFDMSVSGPGRVNQLGGLYINGKPLPKEIREEIIELARLGVRPCDISRRLKITHGCISKLLSKYQKTGSINPGGANVGRPRVITPKIEQKIEQYRREQPGIFSWELRDRLLHENICSRENLPSLSSISRLIKHQMMARAAGNRPEYKTNEGNLQTMKNISSRSTDDILKHQVEEQTGFQSPGRPSVYDVTDAALEGDSMADEECLLIRRQRRQRAKYTSRQLHELEVEFERNPYPNAWDRETLAHKLGIHETRIQVWFSNRRAKGRRKPYGDGATQTQASSPLVCTCHRYSAPLFTPWMIESGPSRLFFPPTGYWEYDSS